jgi:hypothetical protein
MHTAHTSYVVAYHIRLFCADISLLDAEKAMKEQRRLLEARLSMINNETARLQQEIATLHVCLL